MPAKIDHLPPSAKGLGRVSVRCVQQNGDRDQRVADLGRVLLRLTEAESAPPKEQPDEA